MSAWANNVSPVFVLGLRLREPLTLAHVALLDELGSPIIYGGQVLCGDLAVAAYACANPATVSRKRIKSRLAPLSFRVWATLCNPDFTQDAERFSKWFDASIKMPPGSIVSGNGRELAAPWWVNRIAQAMACGFTYAEATTMPLRLVSNVIAAKLEAMGVLEFRTKAQLEFFENIKRWDAQRAN
jgi:hypothetical protein